MYEKFTNFQKWNNKVISETARKFWNYDIPNNKFTYWIFTPKELQKH